MAFSLFLLSQLGAETKYSSSGKFFAQPRLWPAIAVGGMALFGLTQAAFVWRSRAPGWTGEVALWLRSLEFLAWFMVYVAAVPVVGYLPATVAFTTLLACRQGYRTLPMLALSAALGVLIVLVFKAGLSVRIPGGAAYEYLPGWLRSFMILNF